ncbi:Protein transport protein sec9 [Rhizoctonia solani AG-1 IB]|nr:Protein transport protein sec9 [Rhizoctonia solani AG-1 IB]
MADTGYGNTQDEVEKARSELLPGTTNGPTNKSCPNPPMYHASQADPYSRNAGIGDIYARGYGDVDADRAELFAGHQRTQPRCRFDDDNPTDMTVEEEEESVEGIKKDTRNLKQESVQSTRNALKIARQAEETAQNTLLKLGDQSEKIANTEHHLDLAKGSHNRTEDKTSETEKLNQSIFRPRFTFNKEKKRQKEEQRVLNRHELERLEREKAKMDVRDTRDRLGRAGSYGRGIVGGEDVDNYGSVESGIAPGPPNISPEQRQARQTARAKYQFEATQSDDELEDELDENLDEIHDVAKRLKGLAEASGQELDAQNPRLGRISNNADKLDAKVMRTTGRLKRIK